VAQVALGANRMSCVENINREVIQLGARKAGEKWNNKKKKESKAFFIIIDSAVL
jgi:hypothetical protein